MTKDEAYAALNTYKELFRKGYNVEMTEAIGVALEVLKEAMNAEKKQK